MQKVSISEVYLILLGDLMTFILSYTLIHLQEG